MRYLPTRRVIAGNGLRASSREAAMAASAKSWRRESESQLGKPERLLNARTYPLLRGATAA